MKNKILYYTIAIAALILPANAQTIIDSSGITASTTDTTHSWLGPDQTINPTGIGPWPGLTGAHPNEVHGIDHNNDGQFRNTGDATPTTLMLKLDLGANYNLATLRVWNGGYWRTSAGDYDGGGYSGINQADLYYSSATADPGNDFSSGWTLIGTAGAQTFNRAVTTQGVSFGATDEIDLGGIDARWFGIDAKSNFGHPELWGKDGVGLEATLFTGIAEVQFLAAVPTTAPISITSITSVGGGNWELTLVGEASTAYEFRSSTTLVFPGTLVTPLTQGDLGEPGDPGDITDDGDTVTTNPTGDATVQMFLGDLGAVPANFVRAETPTP
jgi:hypothetical protein